jgi:Ca-activated chloride channel family protein
MNDAHFTAYILDQLSAAERAAVEAASRDENVTRSMRDTAQLSQLLREHRAAESNLEASPALMQAIRERVQPPDTGDDIKAVTAVRQSYWRSTLVPVALAASVLLNVVALTYLRTSENASVRVVEQTSQSGRMTSSVTAVPLEMSPSGVPSTGYSVRGLPQESPIALDPSVANALGGPFSQPSLRSAMPSLEYGAAVDPLAVPIRLNATQNLTVDAPSIYLGELAPTSSTSFSSAATNLGIIAMAGSPMQAQQPSPGEFSKDGAGSLTLSGQNHYTGGTTITAGTIHVATGAVAVDASPANTANNLSLHGGTLQFGSAAPQSSVRQSGQGAVISNGGTTTLSRLAAAPQAANAPSPASRSYIHGSGGAITVSAGTLVTENVQLGVADKFQYVAPQEAAPLPQVRALAKNELNTQSVIEQQIRPLLAEEKLLVESLGENHPKVKGVRKQIQVLHDLVIGSEERSNEAYATIHENAFEKVADAPLSTFSIDVDTASYSNTRRFLTQRQLPPADAVRIEELLNYFTYNYPQPTGDVPFSVTTEVARCPWNAKHQLVRIGLKGREVAAEDRPASNLVFLLDVSGSMADQNKLPLVKQGMRMLVRQLSERDHVAIVVYAGASGLVLPSTTGDQKETIIDTLGRLQSGGSTNGGSGLQLAYDVASEHMIRGGINRVILCTDGDFNVGITDRDELVRMIETKAKSGVQLSVLGFGMGNYKDATLEKLADKGDGNYAYIDTELEARKVLVDQLSATLITIAKDVKIQIEFNPARVASYRLLGYENRMMAAADFNNDKKDAGEIGAGHTVTALYEVVTEGVADQGPGVDPLKYQPRPAAINNDLSQEMLTLKLRYKLPGEETSKLIETPVKDAASDFAEASKDFKFSASVAAFGMLLRQSRHAGDATLDTVISWATDGRGSDLDGYREEFLDLVRRAKELKR